MIMLFNQLTGNFAIAIYSTHIFRSLGIPSAIGSVLVGVSTFLGVVFGGVLVKIGLGFKLMLLLAHVLIGIFLVGTSVFSYLVQGGAKEYSTPLVVCLTGIMFMF